MIRRDRSACHIKNIYGIRRRKSGGAGYRVLDMPRPCEHREPDRDCGKGRGDVAGSEAGNRILRKQKQKENQCAIFFYKSVGRQLWNAECRVMDFYRTAGNEAAEL